eukprot:TRINITY_DN46766_c0_g1_i2.p1 TRINITY_DN46766_c0_g1~~TRINITY_DN46766_c0_g1_i2.p1  ORF type:complete len:156 (+),score=2.41 TRINITY_DN46766_c0_g1_i2:787-1254(+)
MRYLRLTCHNNNNKEFITARNKFGFLDYPSPGSENQSNTFFVYSALSLLIFKPPSSKTILLGSSLSSTDYKLISDIICRQHKPKNFILISSTKHPTKMKESWLNTDPWCIPTSGNYVHFITHLWTILYNIKTNVIVMPTCSEAFPGMFSIYVPVS